MRSNVVEAVVSLLALSSGVKGAAFLERLEKRDTCHADNCYRELIDARFYSMANTFCQTYTKTVLTAPSAIPTYLENCQSSPSQVSSACSCIATLPVTCSTSTVAPSCTQNNCLRAVAPCSNTAASRDCSSFLRTTVTPTVTKTVTISATLTASTHTALTTVSTSIVHSAIATTVLTITHIKSSTTTTSTTVTDTVSPSVAPARIKRSASSNPLPSYAINACSATAQFSSACSCIGVHPTTISASASTITKTKTVTISVTVSHTLPVTKTRTILDTSTTETTSSTTTISTETDIVTSTTTSQAAPLQTFCTSAEREAEPCACQIDVEDGSVVYSDTIQCPIVSPGNFGCSVDADCVAQFGGTYRCLYDNLDVCNGRRSCGSNTCNTGSGNGGLAPSG